MIRPPATCPNQKTTLACCLAASLALLASGSAAQVDDVQLRLATQFELPLRWDNVESGRLYWTRGVRPAWRGEHGLHAVRLAPGQSVTVRVPALERLRVRALDDATRAVLAAPAETLSIALSNGSGLYAGQRARRSADGRDRVVDALTGSPQLARVTLAAHAPQAVEVALFVSRHEPLGHLAPYRQLHELAGPALDVQRADAPRAQHYWAIQPGTASVLDVQGPARFALRTRLRYPATEAASAQHWHIDVGLDDAALARLEFATGAENAWAVSIDGREAVVSREKEGYFEVPAGRHRLTLASSAVVIARLLSQRDPDYLFPALNAPAPSAAEARQVLARDATPALRMSDWADSHARAAQVIVRRKEAVPSDVHAAALRLTRDNRSREGGAVAAAAMAELAAQHRGDAALRTEAGEYRMHTFHRDLLPRDKRDPRRLRFAWYLAPRLLANGEQGRGTVVAGQHAGQIPASLDSGFFVPLADGADVAAYDLPQRFAPSSMRVAVHGDPVADGATVFVQYDDQAPTALTISPYPDLPGEAFVPSPAEASLRLQQERFREDAPDAGTREPGDDPDRPSQTPGFGSGTLSGAFSRRFTPAPLVGTRLVDLPLPGTVRRVRLWRAAGDTQPMWVALSYRATKPFRLSERAWLEAARTQRNDSDTDTGALPRLLAAMAPVGDIANSTDGELDSHWQPLARLLRAQAAQLAASVAPPSDSAAVIRRPAAAASAQFVRDAESLAARGQWQGALEAWSRAATSMDATTRERAFEGRITALRQLGESFIAERLVRQRMLHDPDAAARRRARDTLIAMYREANDLDGVQATLAAALLREGAPATGILAALTTTLADNGEPELALSAGLLLPRRERPLETLLRASFAQEWWAVFDELVADLPDPQRKHFWQAQRALGEGRIAQAQAHFDEAGDEGAAFTAHLERARTIHAALRRADQTETGDRNSSSQAQQALAEWAQWQATHPGPRRWHDASHLVSDFAGGQGVYSIDRDAWFTALRADPQRPLRLRVPGPVKLRIEARPLHTTGSKERIEGWLRVRASEREWLAPITANSATPGLQLVGRPGQSAGRAVTQEITLGPGWHDISADAGEQTLLLRVEIEEAELPLPLLPRLTPDTAAARGTGLGVAVQPRRRWPAACVQCSVLLDVRPGEAPRTVRLARNLIDANAATLADTPLPALPPAVPAADKNEAANQNEAALRAAGDWRALLAWPAERSDAALRERLTSLAWIAERQPDQQRAVLALAAEIANAHPAAPGLASLLARIERDAAWTPIESVNHSAGLRSREVVGWDPESPSLRVRRALLGPTADDERVLAGANQLVASFNGTRAAHVELTLAAQDVGALPPQAMAVLMQVDDAAAQRIVLETGHAPVQRRVVLPAGAHTLRVRIETPLADQFLRVRLREPGRQGFAAGIERFYQVATRAEPVRLAIDGPAWLRIDEWKDGRSESRYQRIEGRWQPVVLTPSDGRTESLYRLHLRSIDPGRPRSEPRTLDAAPQPVPPVPLTIADRPQATRVQLDDQLPLGGQEDGTWSAGLAWRERLYGFEDSTRGRAGESAQERERFTELAATHRYFAPAWQTHYRGDLLVRERERGGPTLGLRGSASTSPAWTSWNFQVEGSIFAQSPGNDGSFESAWNLRATATHAFALTPQVTLQPRVSVFWRGQSLGSNGFYALGRIDQDIYSPYRDNHPRGLELGETLTWQPWLDSAFYAGVKIVTNPDMNAVNAADHVAGRVGWRQMLGPLRLDANWDGQHYFEDSHRRDDSSGGALKLELGWEHWLARQQRLELGVTLQRDLARDSNLFGLSLTWHFGNGRAYRDFRPGEIDLRELRERRAPQHENNRMRDEP